MDRHTFAGAVLMICSSAMAAQGGWITVGERAYRQLKSDGHKVTVLASRAAQPGTGEGVYLLEVNARDLHRVAGTLHRGLGHCGGFMFHDTEDHARGVLDDRNALPAAVTRPSYVISNHDIVAPMLAKMEDRNIERTITDLSAFVNRYYSSAHGAQASDWLRKTWEAIGARNPAISVIQFSHNGYGQRSVIATIAGSDKASEVVVLGAHLDSINITLSRTSAVAPGADDDASGVAGLTEVLRVFAASNYRPRRTIKLIGYAAEEVGLRGSQDIARDFKKNNVDVVGVLQLDMTNFKGSEKDIYLIRDYTDAEQNSFLEKLIAAYLPALSVGSDNCGYACSDHASWSAQGYATSMPFESTLRQDNPRIHGKDDTYANSGSQAAHALKFARMAAAYAVELGTNP